MCAGRMAVCGENGRSMLRQAREREREFNELSFSQAKSASEVHCVRVYEKHAKVYGCAPGNGSALGECELHTVESNGKSSKRSTGLPANGKTFGATLFETSPGGFRCTGSEVAGFASAEIVRA